MTFFKNACWTLNNWTEEDKAKIASWEVQYTIYGEEVGENGTPHLQGYTEFSKNMRLAGLKKLHNGIHWEERKGTQDQAIEYCKKDGIVTEFGEKKVQGRRRDLEEVAEAVKDLNIPMKDIANKYSATYIKYSNGIEKLRNLQYEARTEKPIVMWRYGTTGVGKTKYCVEKHDSHYIKDGTQWWNGYTQQEAIIIDDFDGHWPYRDLLRLLDRYAYQGQTKGGYIQINSKYIYITCEHPPEHFWMGNELAQVTRRIDEIVHVVTEVKNL